jgi:hypothetical protein
MLHPQDHKDVRIITQRGADFGDAVQFCLTFPHEFRSVVAHYPILFRAAGEAGAVEALALFGLEDGENLFLGADGNGWDASYVPLAIRRQPFMIGLHGESSEPLIHIDLEHPRVSSTEGEALFLKYGGTSEYMEEVNGVLSSLHAGLREMPAFFAALAELQLLAPFNVELSNGDRLLGFLAIDEDRLAALPADALARLNAAGYLEAVYMAVASLSHLRGLAARKERRRAAGA